MSGKNDGAVGTFASLVNDTGIGTICFTYGQKVTAVLVQADAGHDDQNPLVSVGPDSPMTFGTGGILSRKVWGF